MNLNEIGKSTQMFNTTPLKMFSYCQKGIFVAMFVFFSKCYGSKNNAVMTRHLVSQVLNSLTLWCIKFLHKMTNN